MKTQQQSFGFLWGEAAAFFHTKIKMLVAICGFSCRVARVAAKANMLDPYIINNVYVTLDDKDAPVKCEEAEGCLDFDCPLNKTTWESFKKRTGAKGKKPPNFGERLDFNRGLDGGLQDLSHLIKDRHTGGIILRK